MLALLGVEFDGNIRLGVKPAQPVWQLVENRLLGIGRVQRIESIAFHEEITDVPGDRILDLAHPKSRKNLLFDKLDRFPIRTAHAEYRLVHLKIHEKVVSTAVHTGSQRTVDHYRHMAWQSPDHAKHQG